MGYVYCDLVLRGRREKVIRALVDTGSSYIVLDPVIIEELELTPTNYEVELTLADKRRVRAKLYVAEAEGRRGPVFVAGLSVPIPPSESPPSGNLGLRPNPITGKLEVIGRRVNTYFNTKLGLEHLRTNLWHGKRGCRRECFRCLKERFNIFHSNDIWLMIN